MTCPVCNQPLTQLRPGSVVYGCTGCGMVYRLDASGVLVAEKFSSDTKAEFPPKG